MEESDGASAAGPYRDHDRDRLHAARRGWPDGLPRHDEPTGGGPYSHGLRVQRTHPAPPVVSSARQALGPTRPTLFRAPYGATGRDTLRAARECGMKAVFFWREVVTNGRIAYQVPGGLHPGDILLVHFKPHMTTDFERMLHTIGEQGFTPAPITKYLPARYFRQ
jgi:hypothetical protein